MSRESCFGCKRYGTEGQKHLEKKSLLVGDQFCVHLTQCFPTGPPQSPCAPRCIVKGSARDDLTKNVIGLRIDEKFGNQ